MYHQTFCFWPHSDLESIYVGAHVRSDLLQHMSPWQLARQGVHNARLRNLSFGRG